MPHTFSAISQGETLEEALENLKEAIALVLTVCAFRSAAVPGG